ncbi:LuxR C-terminal-related transcriptional regulator [Millisia brevis]|uniref:LuxR C-terminal-related transcriptional regulator n=1 Tax=Millisia brevis TaxID=264148 RepID=UPI000A078B6B|nr:LuxR C-terminal-related transcriptional regulator [Millisia brevis]
MRRGDVPAVPPTAGPVDGRIDGRDAATIARLSPLVAAPLDDIAACLREVVVDVVPHRALLIFTEDCTGRPQKTAGDPTIIDRATLSELAQIRSTLQAGTVDSGAVGGAERPIHALLAGTGALLVLCEPGPTALDTDAGAFLRAVWEVVAARIRHRVAEADPSYLRRSRAVSVERQRATAELTERHAADLESVLAVLRSRDLDDTRARTVATTVATDALILARAANDLVVTITEEPVSRAFERLRHDLSPLARFGRVQMQFVEPPTDGRALPGEVAHAARAIVRTAVLAINEQDDVGRVRVQWGCDGARLLIGLRDDGPGRLTASDPAFRELNARVKALGGTAVFDIVPDWGTAIDVSIPLDPPQNAEAPAEWDLGPREADVLRLLVAGKRNRQIAAELGISENTVKTHVGQLYRKLGVTSRAAAIAKAIGANEL